MAGDGTVLKESVVSASIFSDAFLTYLSYIWEGLLRFMFIAYIPLALQSERVRFLGKVKIGTNKQNPSMHNGVIG